MSDKPTLVFANSLGTDFRIWSDVCARFENRFRTICYDKRGHGLSDVPGGTSSLDDHVEDLHGLLNLLDAHQIIITGVSVGGLIAQAYCIRYPERVRALVLCDTAARIGTDELWNERIRQVQENGLASIAESILERWFSPDFRQQRGTEFQGCRNMLLRTPDEGYSATCAAIRDCDMTQASPDIMQPALIVCGEHDKATPPDSVEGLSKIIPNAHYQLINAAGHIPSVEQPEVLHRLMSDFFEEHQLG